MTQEESAFLDDHMRIAMKQAHDSKWTEEGQILMVRKHIKGIYAKIDAWREQVVTLMENR